jgi:Lar family restriction alleviation protein
MTDEVLKPCPFCGPGNSIPGVWFDDTTNAYRVSCGRCGSGTGFKPRWTEADAAEAWNTRALASRPQPSVEEVATLIDDAFSEHGFGAPFFAAKAVQALYRGENDLEG